MRLLHSQQHFSVLPQLFKVVVIALVRREDVNDYISVVHNDPAFACFALDLTLLAMRLVHGIDGCIRKGIEHAVAGAGTQDEVVGKRCDVFDVEQENVLPFFVFQ
jgi:hypothetical protein